FSDMAEVSRARRREGKRDRLGSPPEGKVWGLNNGIYCVLNEIFLLERDLLRKPPPRPSRLALPWRHYCLRLVWRSATVRLRASRRSVCIARARRSVGS